MACADAKIILRDRVPPESVRAIHVYYPDPWWKTRHHKRRVFTPEFVASCAKALQAGGKFHLATDVADYFAVMLELCRQRADLGELPPPQIATGRHDMDYLTNFERKARQKGQPVFRALFEKIGS
jgi:tRNA (guanine-N7-)-methyltransferase